MKNLFLDNSPRLSRPCLLSPIISASHQARTPFLKAEAFRLLTQLFVVHESDDSVKKELLEKESKAFAAAIENSFHDEGDKFMCALIILALAQ